MMKRLTTTEEIYAYTMQELERNEKKLISLLNYVGKACINEARDNGDYMDQTGNLRSSIGFMVLRDGKVAHKGGFKQARKGKDGKKEGENFISELISQNRNGLVLLVVAGMNYASYVESGSRNVITSGELLAEQMIPMMLMKLGFQRRTI